MKNRKFTEKEKQNIKKAVENVEKTTSGEIVSYFVNRSDKYYSTAVWASLISGVIFLITIIILSFLWLLPFSFNIIHFSLFQLLLMGFVFVIVHFLPFIKRPLIRYEIKERSVHNEATQAFVNEEVFNTKERTGILIFISEFEHMVEIIADSGINKTLKDNDKKEIVDTIIKGIKMNNPAEGIITAIHLCGNHLIKGDFSIKPGDTNELEDNIRIK